MGMELVQKTKKSIGSSPRCNGVVPIVMEKAPAGPRERSHGVAARRRFNQGLEILQQSWIFARFLLSPTTGPAN